MHALDDMARPPSSHIWTEQRGQEDACLVDAPKASDMASRIFPQQIIFQALLLAGTRDMADHHVGFERPEARNKADMAGQDEVFDQHMGNPETKQRAVVAGHLEQRGASCRRSEALHPLRYHPVWHDMADHLAGHQDSHRDEPHLM
ncbi:hypothetical protein KSF_072840 [Reticulibacter mediterranei]|uniref:Uncharacterized protein n=1 Tax=Reticulibacter mediterranei TaxID=2778369 RepID=A0A8J3IXU3_9CHLR|nr:hypothetical protein [Reticulibacter mediterranei]GHO97236.1 hypothetical protein KSF_072840 [Reticulibacter mediterranei]